ncbi:hypothetical protein MOQ_008621 [Trypanosoma cruzi marinkellei]|uniref:F-box domain-containing protein n=1 Tax=Trypanosoma cruzi marinkellei TaxID=85056 RepID=K2NF95_TRYCR|nr:hypothetical protein MOQ_008621 [Trypanosoma cruzi marinkellei]
MQITRRLPERRGGSDIYLMESRGIVGSILTDLQNPLSPRTVAVELSTEMKTLPSSMEMKEINCGSVVHDVVGMRPKGYALRRRTTPPHSYCSLAHQLPMELVSVIMSFLDARSLFQYRAVCRSFNNAFLSHGIQSLTPSLTSAVMDPTVGTDTLTGVMRLREAILERRERAWSHWLASYMATKISQNVDDKTLQKMRLEGKALETQLHYARRSCRRAREEWLGHQAAYYRARDNIRRNWFNVTSLGCMAGSGVPPVILPDETLCINDPADTILLFVRRDRGMLSCVTRRAKGKVPSRAAEALRDLWCLFDEMTFSSRLSLMCYDPYMDALQVGLENSKILFVKVRSAVVAGLGRRLEAEVKPEESPPSPKTRVPPFRTQKSREGVEVVALYSTAGETLATFVPVHGDAVGLPDYEWSVAEMMAVTNKHGCNLDLTRVILIRHDQDVTASYISTGATPDVCFTEKDALEIVALRRTLAKGDPRADNNERGNAVGVEGSHSVSPAPVEVFFGCGVTGSAGFPASDETFGNNDGGTTTLPINPTEDGRSAMEVNAGDTVGMKQVVKKYVFAVFNEQATLSAVVAYTREVAMFTFGAHTSTCLGVGYTGEAKRVYMIQAPVFRRCETTTGKVMDEGEATVACVTTHSIIICQQLIFRGVQEAEKCVYSDPDDEKSGGDEKHNKKNRKSSAAPLRYCTWYFLRGYCYSSPSREMTVLREVSSPGLMAFLNPRPWLQQHVMAFAESCPEENNMRQQQQQQHNPPPHLNYWWCSLRDGHPYFRVPFILYVTRYMPFILFQRHYTALDRQRIPSEEQTRFQEVRIIEGMSQLNLCVSSMALSPSHAFFLLGMLSGAILLLSPSCADARDDSPKVSSLEHERPFSRLEEASICTSFARIRRRRGIMGMHRSTPPQNVENREEQEQEEEEDEHVALTTPHPPSEPLSHLYRTTPLRTEEEILRQRIRHQPYLHSFTATQVFGNGFREDTFIQKLQRNTSSVFRSMQGRTSSGNNFPLHAIWIIAPRGNSQVSNGAGIRSMHLDEWKLTTLSMSFEVALYDLTPESRSWQDGALVVPLLTISPYKRHPLRDIPAPNEEPWLCAKMRRMLQFAARRRFAESEIMWHNGMLVVSSILGGRRHTIFDFGVAFRDPDKRVKKEKESAVAYSATRKEYRQCTSGLTLSIAAGGENVLALPRHYPLLLRWEFFSLMLLLLRCFGIFFAAVSITLMMLRIDEYISIPHWSVLLFYAPFALNVVVRDILLYDPYYIKGCGVFFYIRILSTLLMFVVFPILFTVRRDAYDRFHPSWVLLTIPLDVSIALTSVSSLYTAACQADSFWGWASMRRIGDFFGQFLCIIFIVLFSMYFDGPSVENPSEPKFDLILAFLPLLLLLFFAFLRAILEYYRTRKRAYAFFLIYVLLVISVPVGMFIWQFSHYYLAVSKRGSMAHVSLIQTCFAIPVFILFSFFCVTLSSITLLASC